MCADSPFPLRSKSTSVFAVGLCNCILIESIQLDHCAIVPDTSGSLVCVTWIAIACANLFRIQDIVSLQRTASRPDKIIEV